MRCELMPLQPSIAFTCRAALAEMPEGFNVWTHFPLSALTEIFVDWTLHFNFDAQEWIGTSIEPWWCTLVAPLMQGLGVEFWSKMCNTKGELFIGRYLRYFDLIFRQSAESRVERPSFPSLLADMEDVLLRRLGRWIHEDSWLAEVHTTP